MKFNQVDLAHFECGPLRTWLALRFPTRVHYFFCCSFFWGEGVKRNLISPVNEIAGKYNVFRGVCLSTEGYHEGGVP